MEVGAELVARARLICGDQHVITNPTVLSTYRSDGMRRTGPLPLAAILPGSASEIANMVSACAASGIPYVVRGAGTSHGGGALPIGGGVLLVLTRMRRIVRIAGAELTVEAGVPIATLPPSPTGSWLEPGEPPEAGARLEPKARLGTVGGYIAETAGVGNVAAITLVRPDGTTVRFDGRCPGYDIAGAFPGSRGRAGIAVLVTLRAVRPA